MRVSKPGLVSFRVAAAGLLAVALVTAPIRQALADSPCPAATVTVSTPAGLAAALAGAQPGNTGVHSLLNGYETHHRNLTKNGLGNWGLNNVFGGNTADVQGPGRGFYIHDPSTTGNVVKCDNTVTNAVLGFANVTCTP